MLLAGYNPWGGNEAHRERTRRLCNIFDIDELPLLEPPPGRESHTYKRVPNHGSETPRDKCAWGRLPLLGRPVLPEQRLAPEHRVYPFGREEQYILDVSMPEAAGENAYGGSSSREYNMHPSIEVMRLKRLRHSTSEDERPNTERRYADGRARGADGMQD